MCDSLRVSDRGYKAAPSVDGQRAKQKDFQKQEIHDSLFSGFKTLRGASGGEAQKKRGREAGLNVQVIEIKR